MDPFETLADEASAIGPASSFGHGSCAVGHQALALGADGVGIACRCGLWLQGHTAPGRAMEEAFALYEDHAARCDLADPAVLEAIDQYRKRKVPQ